MEEQKIRAKVIEEVLGSPKEHVEKTINELVKKIEENFTVKKYTIYEAQQVQTLWSTFAEIEIEFEKPVDMIGFCFDYMPSSVELISPAKLPFTSRDVDDLLNDLIAKLHRYEAALRNLNAENKLLKKRQEEKK